MYKKYYGIIYIIQNKKNGKRYVGATNRGFKKRYSFKGKGIDRVLGFFEYKKRQGDVYNTALYDDIIKYGTDAFIVYTIYDAAYDKVELAIKEYMYIRRFKTTDPKYGYNISTGAYAKMFETKMKEVNKELNMHSKHKVVLLNTREIFISIIDAAEAYGIDNSLVGKCVNGVYKSSISPKNKGERLVWVRYEEYLSMTEVEIEKRIKEANKLYKKVRCINTGEVFPTLKMAADKYNVDNSGISACCKGKKKSNGKLNGEPLRWEYVE